MWLKVKNCTKLYLFVVVMNTSGKGVGNNNKTKHEIKSKDI